MIISWPEERPAVALVGGKAATLGRLQLAWLPVPRFFSVTTGAYRRFAAAAPVRSALERLRSNPAGDLAGLSRLAADVRRAIQDTPMPAPIADAIEAAVDRLGGAGASLAVRSSATVEDLAERSFAGLYRSFLDVPGAGVADAVKDCWASLWTAEGVFVRSLLDARSGPPAMAVLVQTMVDADVAGVVFTEGPLPHQAGHLVVNAGRGLGDGVVSGTAPTDTYLLTRDDLGVAERHVAPRNGSAVPALDDKRLEELAGTARRIEELLLQPQDIEWCYQDDTLHILQSRPVPTAGVASDGDVIDEVRRSVTGRDREAYWWISNNMGRTPLTPFTRSIWPVMAAAREAASEALALPTVGTWAVFGDYVYAGARAVAPGPETAAERARRRAVACDETADRWERGFLPEVRANNDHLRGLDLQAASPAELVGHLRGAVRIWERHWEIHDLAMNAKGFVVEEFTRTFRRLFGPGRWRSLLKVLQAPSDSNLQINHAIWELARLAGGNETVLRLLDGDLSPATLERLRLAPDAAEFVVALDAFLDRWGDRIVGPIDLTHPSWREDPSFVLRSIALQARTPGEDPTVKARQLQREREEEERRLLRELEQRGEDRDAFVRLMRRAQRWPEFNEDHNLLIEQGLAANVRRIALELGRRLRDAGSIGEPGDVLFLEMEDVAAAVGLPGHTDLRAVTRVNRERYERKKGVLIPQTLGSPVATGAPPDGAKAADGDVLSMQFHPDPARELPARLVGIPAAPGHATGPARLIDDIDEFAKVLPGDILVCQRTAPPWTPLFSVIAGVVTNAGHGVLQHSAINAREFGIPAVIGTQVATEVISPGQVIAVDGTSGRIELST